MDALDGVPVMANALMSALTTKRSNGTPMFPLLSGPKIGPMWIRMLAFPGGANITGIEIIPVAVDTHVQRVTEMLGLVQPHKLDDAHRAAIQAVWFRAAKEAGGYGAPREIDGTAAGIDPALWALGRKGCTRCEAARRKIPVGPVCQMCVLGRV
jgi:hypothetical protein